jgi:TetR/AcrR family transcriptional regulator, mexJK operon transcriptional repressor
MRFIMRSPVPKSSAGRPTREQAEARHEALLDTALDMFLDKGFELTTIDAVAARLGMTKRTVYARHTDKAALFRAAVDRAVKRYTVPIETVRASETDDLEETLTSVAHIRIANLMTAEGLRLQRVLYAEGFRFPEIFDRFYAEAAKPTVDYLVDLLRRKGKSGEIATENPEAAAIAFMSMVVGTPARSLVAGGHIAPAELEARIRFSVRLFLNGVRPRTGEDSSD